MVEITGALFIMEVKVDINDEETINRIKENQLLFDKSTETCPDDDRFTTADLECDFGENFEKIKTNFKLKAVGQLFPSLRVVRGNYISSRLPQDCFQLTYHASKIDQNDILYIFFEN